jgi:hypothetical protein
VVAVVGITTHLEQLLQVETAVEEQMLQIKTAEQILVVVEALGTERVLLATAVLVLLF